MRRVSTFPEIMHKTLSNLVVVTMVLVAFVGQAMAYSVLNPCDFSADTHVSEAQGESEVHDNANQTNADCCDTECCDVDCICAANACSSAVYLNADNRPTFINVITVPIYKWSSERPKSISSLLYRPPIFTC